jgi:hypothetical protein
LEISHETANLDRCDRGPDRGVLGTCSHPYTGSTDDSAGSRRADIHHRACRGAKRCAKRCSYCGAKAHRRASDGYAGDSDKPVNGERRLAASQLRLREYTRGGE